MRVPATSLMKPGRSLGVLQKLCDLESAVEDIPAKTVDLLGIRETPMEMVHTRQEYESFDLLGIWEPVSVGEGSPKAAEN